MDSSHSSPTISIVIPVLNKWELTKACLESLAQHTPAGVAEVIVVDNGSTDETVHALAPLGNQLFGSLFAPIRWEENRNFGPACNAGAAAARAPMLFFLNNDTLLTPNWLPPLLEAFETDPRLGAVGPLLLYEDGTVQHMGVTFSPPLSVAHLYAHFPATHRVVTQKRRLQALTAAALMVPKTLFQECGSFFSEYRNGFEDVELSLRIVQQGRTLECIPSSKIIHLESQTPGRKVDEGHNSRVLSSRCAPLCYPDVHHHALRDGFSLALDDRLHLCVLVGKEESEKLFTSASGKTVEDLWDIATANPLWVDGCCALAQHLEAAEAYKEAALFLGTAARIKHTFPMLKNQARLAKKGGDSLMLEEVLQQMKQLYEFRNAPDGALLHCKAVLQKARAVNDSTLEKLYTDSLSALGGRAFT